MLFSTERGYIETNKYFFTRNQRLEITTAKTVAKSRDILYRKKFHTTPQRPTPLAQSVYIAVENKTDDTICIYTTNKKYLSFQRNQFPLTRAHPHINNV